MEKGAGPSDRTILGLIVAAGVAAAAVALFFLARRRVSDSDRSEQETRGGEPVETEWGKESFPASDPPQSW